MSRSAHHLLCAQARLILLCSCALIACRSRPTAGAEPPRAPTDAPTDGNPAQKSPVRPGQADSAPEQHVAKPTAASAHTAELDRSHLCTLIGCWDQAVATFKIAPEFETGTYQLLLTTREDELACTLSFPIEKDAHSRTRCEGRTSSLDLQIHNWARWGLMVEATWERAPLPTEVKAVLMRDHQRLASASGQFSYKNFTPNGPECGPACRGGRVVLALAPRGSRGKPALSSRSRPTAQRPR